MGNVHSNVLQHLETQFLQLQDVMMEGHSSAVGPTCRNISLHSLQRFAHLDQYPINLEHIPTLFLVDANHDGWFSLDDLNSFAQWCATAISNHSVTGTDFCELVQAKALHTLWSECDAAGGITRVTEWMCLLGSAIYPSQTRENPSQTLSLPELGDNRSGDFTSYEEEDTSDLDAEEIAGLERGMLYEKRVTVFLDVRAVGVLFRLLSINGAYDLTENTFIESVLELDRLSGGDVHAQMDLQSPKSEFGEGAGYHEYVTEQTMRQVLSVFLQSLFDTVKALGFDKAKIKM